MHMLYGVNKFATSIVPSSHMESRLMAAMCSKVAIWKCHRILKDSACVCARARVCANVCGLLLLFTKTHKHTHTLQFRNSKNVIHPTMAKQISIMILSHQWHHLHLNNAYVFAHKCNNIMRRAQNIYKKNQTKLDYMACYIINYCLEWGIWITWA